MLPAMKFGYTILYVDDVEATVAFYEKAFGLTRKMVVPAEYGELETGSTRLAFAAKAHVKKLFTVPVQEASAKTGAPPVELGLVTKEVGPAFERAVAAGAIAVAAPQEKPWGQTVSYVRDLNGFLIEICTPMD